MLRGVAVLSSMRAPIFNSAVQYMTTIKRPVTFIGTSRGTIRAAEGMAARGSADALVLTSGFSARGRAAVKMSCRSSAHRLLPPPLSIPSQPG